jgi:hypothetical protein
VAAFSRLDAIMKIGSAIPSEIAAEVVLKMAATARAGVKHFP